MDDFLKLSPGINERAPEQSQDSQLVAEQSQQYSQLVAELFGDKHLLAENAISQFSKWDADQSGDLTEEELSFVSTSPTSSLSDRATASVLKQNFQSASALVESSFNYYTKKNSELSGAGRSYMNSVFAGDWNDDGISKEDLTALSMLSSDSGNQKFIKDAESSLKYSIARDAAATGTNGVVAALELTTLIASRGKVPVGWLLPISSYLFVDSGLGLIDGLKHNDISEMGAQFSRRKSMLDSWTMRE